MAKYIAKHSIKQKTGCTESKVCYGARWPNLSQTLNKTKQTGCTEMSGRE